MIAIRRVWDSAADANPVLRVVLILLSKLYEAGMRIRAVLYLKGVFTSRKLPCLVISVGNITSGGTGKTPMIMYLARYLTARDLKVAVVSRGYRSRLETGGGIVSDGQNVLVGVDDSGDEPYLLAAALTGVPVIVGADRYRAGRQAVRAFSPDVILLDDAFQHLKLKRDLDLVLLDSRRPLGNGFSLPAGELREPLRALGRGDAVIFTRCDTADGALQAKKSCTRLAEHFGGPVFNTRHVPVIRKVVPGCGKASAESSMAGRRVFAFSGVAKNDEFLYTLSEFKCELAGSLGFPDHHRYSDGDLARICRRAEKLDADFIVTTEKDYVKIKNAAGWPADLVVMGIDISFGDDKERFHAFLEKKGNPGSGQK
jgi:tetraacyldisaccharide 4'-kinase